jgi:myo-inositol-1(or 4)-monophosphatase
MLNIAIGAARSAGNVIVRNLERVDRLTIGTKQRNDFVTEVDRLAEHEIIRVIHRAYPDHAILAEESGAQGDNEYEWVIDPLDGTTNFLHGFPQFAVSIALRHRGRLDQAVVYDPLRQELFTASRGSGATLNDRRIRVSRANGLTGSPSSSTSTPTSRCSACCSPMRRASAAPAPRHSTWPTSRPVAWTVSGRSG